MLAGRMMMSSSAAGAAKRNQAAAAENGRPSTSSTQEERPQHRSHRQRVAERLEVRREHKAEKARLKAEKPKLHADWYMKARALWMMFSMSYYTKIVLGLGIIMVLIAIILIALTASSKDDLKDADTVIALLCVFGAFFIIIAILATRSRRREKDKRRRLGYDKKTGRYGSEKGSLNTSNGTIATISEDIEGTRGHINGIPLQERLPPGEPKAQKQTFTAVKADEETGFTNLALIMDADQLPGTPYRQKRKESMEASLTTYNRNHVLASSSLRDDPEILVVPPPRDKLSAKSDGSKIKKSRSPKGTPNKSTLHGIPEQSASPRSSPVSARKAPPIVVDTDEVARPSDRAKKKKRDHTPKAFDDGDITP